MDNSLIAMLVIVVLSALSSWLQKRSQTQERGPSGGDRRQPRPSRPVPPAAEPAETAQPTPSPRPGLDWEKELRRLFEGDAPSSPPPVAPPPLVLPKSQPHPATPPMLSTARPTPPPLQTASEPTEGPAITLASLTQSEEAYRQARQLHEKTAVRLRQVTAQTRQHRSATPTRQRSVPVEIAAAAAMIRDPKTVRQAIVASLILEPAKAFEP